MHASCLGGNRKKDSMILMERAFFYVQDTRTVERQNGIWAKEHNVTRNFPDICYRNAKGNISEIHCLVETKTAAEGCGMKSMETKNISKSAQRTCVNGHWAGDLENIESVASGITNTNLQNLTKKKKKKRMIWKVHQAEWCILRDSQKVQKRHRTTFVLLL